MISDNEIEELISKYNVDLSILEKVVHPRIDEMYYIEKVRILQETFEYRRTRCDVIDLINNTISHDLIQLKEKIDELEEDIIKGMYEF